MKKINLQLFFIFLISGIGQANFIESYLSDYCYSDGKYTECVNKNGIFKSNLQDIEGAALGGLLCLKKNGQYTCEGDDILARPIKLDEIKAGALVPSSFGFCAIVDKKVICYSDEDFKQISETRILNPSKLVGTGPGVCALAENKVWCHNGRSWPMTDWKQISFQTPQDIYSTVFVEGMVNDGLAKEVCALDGGYLKCWDFDKGLVDHLISQLEGVSKAVPGYAHQYCAYQDKKDRWTCSVRENKDLYTVPINKIKELVSVHSSFCFTTEDNQAGCISPPPQNNKEAMVSMIDKKYFKEWKDIQVIPHLRQDLFCLQSGEEKKCFRSVVDSGFTLDTSVPIPILTTKKIFDFWHDENCCNIFSNGDWWCKGKVFSIGKKTIELAKNIVIAQENIWFLHEDKVMINNHGMEGSVSMGNLGWKLQYARPAAYTCHPQGGCQIEEELFLLGNHGFYWIGKNKETDSTYKIFEYKGLESFATSLKNPKKFRVLERMGRILCVLDGETLSCVNSFSKKQVLQINKVKDFDSYLTYYKENEKYLNQNSYLCASTQDGLQCYQIESSWDGKSETVRDLFKLDEVDSDFVSFGSIAPTKNLPPLKLEVSNILYELNLSNHKISRLSPSYLSRFDVKNIPLMLHWAAKEASDWDREYVQDLSLLANEGSSSKLLSYFLVPYFKSNFVAQWANEGLKRAAQLIEGSTLDLSYTDEGALLGVQHILVSIKGKEVLLTPSELLEVERLKNILNHLYEEKADKNKIRSTFLENSEKWIFLFNQLKNRTIIGPRMESNLVVLNYLLSAV